MLYFRCPTCRTLLAHKQIPLEEGLKKICGNPKLSEEEKKKQKTELLDRLELKRYCCRMRITYVKQVEIIK